MDLATFAEILEYFPRSKAAAKTVEDIASEWDKGKTHSAKIRKIYRIIKEFCSRNADDPEDFGDSVAMEDIRDLIVRVPKSTSARRGGADRFFIDMDVATLFFSDSVALQLVLGDRVINTQLTDALTPETWHVRRKARDHLAHKAGLDTLASISDKIRIVQDGFARMPAVIEPEILKAMIEALKKKQEVTFDYTTPAGKTWPKTVFPRGLVSKDGTLYLVSTKAPAHERQPALPLHRMSNVRLNGRIDAPVFDLDAHLDETGQLNHPMGKIGATIRLEMMVHKSSLYHFEERKIGPDQVITPPVGDSEWHHLAVTTRHYFSLTAFLASFGRWVKVLGPKEIMDDRDGIRTWAIEMANIYESDLI